MIEAETVSGLAALPREVEMPFAVRFRGAQNRGAIVSTIRHNHALNWGAGRVKNNTFDPPGKLGLFDNYKFPNCLCGACEECAHKRVGD
jgi:hypothetical protein